MNASANCEGLPLGQDHDVRVLFDLWMYHSETARPGRSLLCFAEGWDAEQQRYRGLLAGQIGSVTLAGESVLVKLEVAARQLSEDQAKVQTTTTGGTGQLYSPTGTPTGVGHAARC